MAPDPGEMPRHAACPACGAALRPGSPWCTLCYADLRPPQERPAQPVAAPAPAVPPPVGDPLTQPLIDFLPGAVPYPSAPVDPLVPAPAGPSLPDALTDPDAVPATWPCTTCGTRNPLAADRCAACQAPFLAKVAAESRQALVLPVVGDLTRLSRGQRLMGAFGVVVVLVLFVAVVTLLLSQRPPEGGGSTDDVPSTQPSTVVVPQPGLPTTPPTTAPTTAPTTGPTGGPATTAPPGSFPPGFPGGLPSPTSAAP